MELGKLTQKRQVSPDFGHFKTPHIGQHRAAMKQERDGISFCINQTFAECNMLNLFEQLGLFLSFLFWNICIFICTFKTEITNQL